MSRPRGGGGGGSGSGGEGVLKQGKIKRIRAENSATLQEQGYAPSAADAVAKSHGGPRRPAQKYHPATRHHKQRPY